MAIKRNAEATKNYDIKVTRVKEFDSNISFDMEVNGVTIYGCSYRTYTRKDGSEFSAVSFPAKKGSDDKYYNHVYFKISEDMLADIEKQIETML